MLRNRESNLSYKGEIIRDQSFENFYEDSSLIAGEFIKATKEGKRQEWISSFYNREDFDDSDSGVIFSIFDRASLKNGLDLFQCESCGRIFIEKESESSAFVSFKPEDDDWKGILEV